MPDIVLGYSKKIQIVTAIKIIKRKDKRQWDI